MRSMKLVGWPSDAGAGAAAGGAEAGAGAALSDEPEDASDEEDGGVTGVTVWSDDSGVEVVASDGDWD